MFESAFYSRPMKKRKKGEGGSCKALGCGAEDSLRNPRFLHLFWATCILGLVFWASSLKYWTFLFYFYL
ncbi:hypothetical protein V6Z11_D13G046400 [Gossypium hirsutum]